MKDNLFKVCGQRGDSHAEEVSSRITCAIIDLYAQMHDITKDVLQVLFNHEILSTAVESTSKQYKPDPVNLAFSCVISLLKSDPGKLWNFVDVYDVYSQSKTDEGFDYGDEGQHNADANNSGQKCARSSLIQKLQEHVGYVTLCYVHKING